jgi:hypothetical protein
MEEEQTDAYAAVFQVWYNLPKDPVDEKLFLKRLNRVKTAKWQEK